MSDSKLIERLDALGEGVDYSNPNTYADLLGYNEVVTEATPPAASAPQAETATPAPATPQATPPAVTESSAPAVTAEPASEADVAGVVTKDGKRTIPYSVLQDARARAAQEAAARQELQQKLEQMQQQLEQAKAGKPTEADAAAHIELTEEELQELADFPAMEKLANGYRALQQQLEQVRAQQSAQPAPAPQQAQVETVNVQDAIDQHSLLVQWQSKGNAAWQEAVRLDQQLQTDPAWAGKSLTDRFAEVQRRVAEDLGIPVPAPAAATPPPAAAPAAQPKPAPRVEQATPTLTDFNGSPAAVGDPLAGMHVGQMVDATMNMSMEDIRRMAGLSY